MPISRQYGTHQNSGSNSHRVSRVRKCERANEQTHGEANATKNSYTINLPPARALRHLPYAELHCNPSAAEDSNLFADKQSCRDPEWNRRDHRTECESRQRYTRIGKGKNRGDAEMNPGFEPVLGALQH